MRLVIQRVKQAQVCINGTETRQIGRGLMVLVGVEEADTLDDVQWLASKTAQMRIFSDDQGKMNLSVIDVMGEVLVISQFTLFAQTAKGNRPSFIRSARPETAIPLLPNQLGAEFWRPLLGGLADKGFGRDPLREMQRIIEAEKSDLFDVLAYVAFALPTETRATRADRAKAHNAVTYGQKQQAFLTFVLDQYVTQGVDQLDADKLTPLRKLWIAAKTHVRGR